MKRTLSFALSCAIVVASAALLGFATAGAVDEADLDIEIIMSDMPLGQFQKMSADEEHQANDMGPAILIIVERCNGTPI